MVCITSNLGVMMLMMLQKFANAEINHTLLTYLTRYKEFGSADDMRRVVSLLHRQAVKAKAEGLFFNVGRLPARLISTHLYLPSHVGVNIRPF